jgi:hypothetical protein
MAGWHSRTRARGVESDARARKRARARERATLVRDEPRDEVGFDGWR